MRATVAMIWCAVAAVAVAADESTTAAAVPKEGVNNKDQTGASSDLDSGYLDLGSISSSLLSSDSWKPIFGPPSQHALDYGAEEDVKTVTLTKQVPVPYPVTVERRVPVRVEVPVDKPYPVYVPRPYHVVVEKKVPYHVRVAVPKPYTVEKHVPVPVRVPVDKPVPVAVPHPYPVVVYKKVPYTVERHVPYPVKVPYIRPYPVRVPVEKHVPVRVEKVVPYPVHVPVDHPVPVPVEKPVPYPVEKIVRVPVEKIVPVPYRVPVKVHVQVPVPVPVLRHYPSHEASGSHEQYSSTDHSHQNQQLYQVGTTREQTDHIPHTTTGHYSEVYWQAEQNQWAQLGPAAHYQSETPQAPHGREIFSQEHKEAAGGLLDQENTYHQVGTNIKVDQGQDVHGQYAHGQTQSQDDHALDYFGGFVYSQGESSQAQNHSPPHLSPHPQQHYVSGSIPQQQHDGDPPRNEAKPTHQNDIADFEKRLKDGRQESYSKVNMGPTAYSNAISHG